MYIAVIGFGNLGKAFVNGLLAKEFIQKDNIIVCAKSEKTIQIAKDDYHIKAGNDIIAAINDADVIVFAVKLSVFDELSEKFAADLFHDKTIISLMAGAGISHILETTKTTGKIIRAMPNLAIAIGNGIIGYTHTEDDRIIRMFENLGLSFLIDESDIEKMTAFSACGLGFAAYVLDCFASAGKELGFDEKICKQIVNRNFENAIDMGDYKQTISAVATKGGATEHGIQFLHDSDLSGIIDGAIKKAYEKVNKV
ncbi:MAG: pyrroline-5-carboxylate reductase family protein [Eubacteriales bacterium]